MHVGNIIHFQNLGLYFFITRRYLLLRFELKFVRRILHEKSICNMLLIIKVAPPIFVKSFICIMHEQWQIQVYPLRCLSPLYPLDLNF